MLCKTVYTCTLYAVHGTVTVRKFKPSENQIMNCNRGRGSYVVFDYGFAMPGGSTVLFRHIP